MLFINLGKKPMMVVDLFVRLFTGQGLYKIGNLEIYIESYKNKILVILMVTIWLQSASILCKAFSGLLLNTYFNIRKFPIVNDMRDIISNKHLEIAANPYQIKLLYLSGHLEIDHARELLTRINKFIEENNFNHDTDYFESYIFRGLITGKTIIMCNSMVSEIYREHFRDYNGKFNVAENKYSMDHVNFIVSKKSHLYHLMKFL